MRRRIRRDRRRRAIYVDPRSGIFITNRALLLIVMRGIDEEIKKYSDRFKRLLIYGDPDAPRPRGVVHCHQ
jgi:hypothetical protein